MAGADEYLDVWGDVAFPERYGGAQVRRALGEFLLVPLLEVGAFLLLGIAVLVFEHAGLQPFPSLHSFLTRYLVKDPSSAASLLATIASSVITVTSITASLLLVVVQQAATSLTSEVFDQFLRRRLNQLFFGYFVGLALLALLMLVTVHRFFLPVYGVLLVFLLTAVGLILLLILFYESINQMRPTQVISAMEAQALKAWERHRRLLGCTRRRSAFEGPMTARLHACESGYVTGIDLSRIGRAVREEGGDGEIEILAVMGAYVVVGDTVAIVRARTAEAAERVGRKVLGAMRLEAKRDIATDASYAVTQIETVAWTSISSAKSNPSPGIEGIRALRDLLARWLTSSDLETDRVEPVVYRQDPQGEVVEALGSLAVASLESMQHQTLAQVLAAFTDLLPRLSEDLRQRVLAVIAAVIPRLGETVVSPELSRALHRLAAALSDAGEKAAARNVRDSAGAAPSGPLRPVRG